MKILTLHVDYINFKPLKKALKTIKELSESEKEGQKIGESLVVLTAVEKGDSVKDSGKELVKNVKDVSKQLNVKDIVLYPYAHLSSNLASPDVAVGVLDDAEKELGKSGFKVIKAPFGYYKEFELKVKGHPLSELSREITSSRIGQSREIGKGVLFRSEEKSERDDEVDSKRLLREVSKTKLDTSKLKKNDHRILGQQMDLFSFSETAPGMVFWHNNGLIIRNELIGFWREVHKNAGYHEIATPQILDKKLWQISGHWEKYKENIFLTEYEKRKFAVKPMNCPGGLLVFKNKPKSYRDFPLRVGELGLVHRQELSGVLGGLFRVIQFTQDDAHIFCTDKQLETELLGVIDLVELFYSKFDFKYSVELSTRPEKRIGSDKMWDKAENILEKVLKKKKLNYKISKGEGVFYGPKIDYHIKDSLGRTWQCGTIQVDFSMPERFDLEYVDKDNKRKRPIMIHRAIYGSLERFIGILLEHYKGRLPVWLSPVQVRILSFTERNEKYAVKVVKRLREEIPEIRLDTDFRNTTIPAKVKEAEIMKIPYIVVIGDKEEKSGNMALRIRGDKKIKSVKLEKFIKDLKKEIEGRGN